MSKEIDQMVEGVQYLVQEATKQLPHDITYRGLVTTVEGNGLYTVLINGKSYTNTPTLSTKTFTANSVVWVLFPQNNSTLRVILG